MSESSLCSSSGDFHHNLEKLKSEIYETKSFDLSKLQLIPKQPLEETLFEWRHEQLQKIEEELQLLLTIENMMKNSEGEVIDGYTDLQKIAALMKKVREGV